MRRPSLKSSSLGTVLLETSLPGSSSRADYRAEVQSSALVRGSGAVCRLAEGQQPWSSTTSNSPELELTDADAGIWALAGPPAPGGLILGGTEDGTVLAWDMRTKVPAWQVKPGPIS